MSNWEKIIIDLCGGTGAWSQPYRDAGYQTIVVDPLAPDLPHGQAFRGTVEQFIVDFEDDARRYGDKGLSGAVRGVLAAPPCDHFSGSGAQYWPAKDADGRTTAAIKLVVQCLYVVAAVKPTWWALENPIGRMRSLVPSVGPLRLQFNPCDYGDPYTKKTQLFGSFNAALPINRVDPVRSNSQGSWLQSLGGKSAKTKRLRSATPQGFARAFFSANP